MKFDYITVVCIDGRERCHTNAQHVILKSMHQLPGSKGLLLTPSKPSILSQEIDHAAIPKLGYHEYSLFIVYALHQYIQTDFAIIVQEDGWVLNGHAWQHEFTNYDFVGAPIHLAQVVDRSGQQTIYQGFGWTQFLGQEEFKIKNVFNGGFSLRSKKFLEAPAKFKIPYVIPAPIGLGKFPKILCWEDEANQEDVQLCLYMRDSLERVGIKFPNLEIAKNFSFEHLTPKLHEKSNLNKILGHHASLRSLSKNNTILYPISFQQASGIYGENRVIDMFSKLGYNLRFEG